MSRLSQLAGKGKKITIGGIELDIKPLTVSDVDLLTRLGEKEPGAIRELLVKVLKEAVPDSTEDEIDKMSVEHIASLIEAITEVNNIDMDKQKLLDDIKAKQKK